MADDGRDLVWRGPFKGFPRVLTVSTTRSLATAVGLLWALAGIAIIPFLVGWTEVDGLNKAGMAAVFAFVLVITPSVFTARFASEHTLETLLPTLATIGIASAVVLLALVVVFVGPTFGSIAVFFVEIPLLAFFVMRTRWAVVLTALALAGYALALVALDNPPAPAQQFVNLPASAVATGGVMGGTAQGAGRARREAGGLERHWARGGGGQGGC